MRTGAYIRFCIGFFLSLCSSAACAQSLFGVNFIGEHRFGGSARHHALGLSAFALYDTSSALTPNISTLAEHNMVTFSIFEVFGMSRMQSETEAVDQNRFQLPAVMLSVPLRRGVVFGLGYRTRFEGVGDCSVGNEAGGVPQAVAEYKRRISLFGAPLIVAWKATEWINVAGELQIERGSIRDDVSQDVTGTSSVSSISSRKRSYDGTSWGVAALVHPHERVYIGAVFDDRIGYDVEESFSYSYSALDSSATGEFELPASFGAGISVGLSKRWWLSSSYWTRGAPEPSGFAQLAGSLRDEYLIAFGVERTGVPSGGFFSRIPMRFGFYENCWHLEYPSGKPVKARFVTLGSGFPMPGGPGTLDFSIEIGQIGSVNDNGLNDRMIRFGLGVNVAEQWSRRREGQR